MRSLLALAAASLAVPAAAMDPEPMQFSGNFGVTVHSGSSFVGKPGRDHRRHRRADGVVLYDRDYQGDTAWRSDGFNDWWHDRPERSYPRWLLSNHNCDRMWWSGGAWRG